MMDESQGRPTLEGFVTFVIGTHGCRLLPEENRRPKDAAFGLYAVRVLEGPTGKPAVLPRVADGDLLTRNSIRNLCARLVIPYLDSP